MDRGEPEQRLEGGHRRAPAIEAEGELVQVDLEVGMTNTVVGTDQPGLQVAEDPVDAGQELLGAASVPLGAGPVAVAQRAEWCVALPGVSDDTGAGLDASGTTWSRTRPEARPRISTAPTTSTLSSSCRPPRNPTSGPPM
jgi:hypothetical protein